MKTCWQYFLYGMTKSVITIVSSFVFLGYVGSSGAVGIVPHDLSVGDTYQLIFVTEGGITAGSGKTFADYDNFVDAEANRSGSF